LAVGAGSFTDAFRFSSHRVNGVKIADTTMKDRNVVVRVTPKTARKTTKRAGEPRCMILP
jgi:hypothetical protein